MINSLGLALFLRVAPNVWIRSYVEDGMRAQSFRIKHLHKRRSYTMTHLLPNTTICAIFVLLVSCTPAPIIAIFMLSFPCRLAGSTHQESGSDYSITATSF
ncbi:hypothetical protein BO82DRAFT_38096 [Aspergillus uvarum CBS 121591]|uniref:Uncharacterized protein n=1 Tax=Aspergillus uvarum CBS 121591 TaxID=1448315 RepID=A0A319CH71_9EURO|nr:hypothetical protein BO82DRAFT_38096 [Aspergillus uvarum CBS 121591]PYH83649.1 hypothetical protein BO82DRAFT_38096 [Aspergillus uvarum CBS 121591]